MKNFILSLFVLASISAFGQSPQKMSYQAVVRDAQNQLLQNDNVGVKISILEGSSSGSVVFSEIHVPTTNENGLFSIEVGNGTLLSGDFSLIPWATNSYWLKSELDLDGGTNYTLTTVSQFLSVPYALNASYAQLAGNGIETLTDNGDGTLTFEFVNGSTYTTPVLSGIQGAAGADGASAYEIWLAEGNVGTENDFLTAITGAAGAAGQNGLNGNDGQDGTNGLSAYQIWLNAGNTGTEADFINFLKGTNGTNGVSVANSYIQNDSLRLELSNGQTLNSGYLAGVSITNTVIQNDSLIVSLSNGQILNAGYLYNNPDDFDFFFPEGKNGQSVVLFSDSTYTVPLGKTLYITYGYADMEPYGLTTNSNADTVYLNGKGVFPELTTLTMGQGSFYNGILVDKSLEIVNWKTTSSYTVPPGKQLYLLSFRTEINRSLKINGLGLGSGGGHLPLLILPSGTVLNWQNSYQNKQWVFTGYLK